MSAVLTCHLMNYRTTIVKGKESAMNIFAACRCTLSFF